MAVTSHGESSFHAGAQTRAAPVCALWFFRRASLRREKAPVEERHLGEGNERLGPRILLSKAHAVLGLLSQTAEFTHAR